MSKDNLKSAVGGKSNTPPTAYFNKSVCIDYLKFRFDIDYSKDSVEFRKLTHDLLHIERNEIQTNRINKFYTYLDHLAPGIDFLYGGSATKTKDEQKTSLLEMKGTGCREFEFRYYSNHKDFGIRDREDIIREGWILLLEECQKLRGKCTRIDIPTDDFSGSITIDEIREKIDKKEFTTRMRRLESIKSNDEDDDEEDERPDNLKGISSVIDSKLTGYSATFGNHEHVQLCIYDKWTEQTKKGFPVKANTWIRYEVRYFHENADLELHRLLKALKAGKEAKHIVACLAGLFEFKEPHSFNNRNKYKAKVWSKWVEFIGDAGKEGSFAKVPSKSTIQTTIAWLISTVSTAFTKVLLTVDAPITEVVSALIVAGLKRVDQMTLQEVNQHRRLMEHKAYEEIQEMVDSILDNVEFQSSYSQEVSDLFFSRKELKKDDKDGK